MNQYQFELEATGTIWKIIFWSNVDYKNSIQKSCSQLIEKFEKTYTRFQDDSFLMSLNNKTGTFKVPIEFIDILKLYQRVYLATNKSITPIGGKLIDNLGYDKDYTLKYKNEFRKIPNFLEAISIVGNNIIKIHEPVFFDIGAVGKGYLADKVLAHIKSYDGIVGVLVNAGGDLAHWSHQLKEVDIALENPFNFKEAIGIYKLDNYALASSSATKKCWGNYYHIYDANTGKNNREVIATWVLHKKLAIADILATSLFVSDYHKLLKIFNFEYIILFRDKKIKLSSAFKQSLFYKK